MVDTKSFWSACESIPGFSAVELEWRQKAGEDYDIWKPFLAPIQIIASSIPCNNEHTCGCYHRVVDHGNGKMVAVCSCDPAHCDSFPVTRKDLVVHMLHFSLLCDTISKALSIRADFSSTRLEQNSEVRSIRVTWRIGIDTPTKGYKFPVYFTCQHDPRDFGIVVHDLKTVSDTPFILVSPTDTWYQAQRQSLFNSDEFLFLTVPDILVPVGNGKFRSNPVAADLIKRFYEKKLPNSGKASMKAFFDTPADAAWNNVFISFDNRDTVSVRVKSRHGIFSYVEMGMADGRTGKPNKQWELLYAFAQGRGTLDWEHPDADKKNKKRKEMLSQDLREFFRMEDDPFFFDKESKGWIVKFHIEPD
ncbi:MAG: hypothetical protein ACYC27_16245 [Armatimonadota bacterium]